MRYQQDLAEFIPIADGARLIQERAGLSEDEAREDIVFAVRDRALESQWWCTSRGERSRRFRGDLPHGFLDNLAPDLIDWKRSIARRRGVGAQFKVEIEVSRVGVCHLWPDLSETPASQETSEALATSNAPHPRSQSETAKLRKRVTKWIEEFAVTDEAKPLVKADFFQLAQNRVKSCIPISHHMFREAWSAAEIPGAFKKAGVRLPYCR